MLQIKNILTDQSLSGTWKSPVTPGKISNPLAQYNAEKLLEVIINFHEFLAKKDCYKTWHPTLHVDEYNEQALLKICASFAQDEKALKQLKMRKNRGIIICGTPSQGKTHILTLFQMLKARFNRESSFGMVDTHAIVRDFELLGSKTIDTYSYRRNYKNNLMDYAYDDILAERHARYYGGPEILVMPEVIAIREGLFNTQGILTHFTSNHRSGMIKEVYGERAFERLHNMCDAVVFPPEAKNYRSGFMV